MRFPRRDSLSLPLVLQLQPSGCSSTLDSDGGDILDGAFVVQIQHPPSLASGRGIALFGGACCSNRRMEVRMVAALSDRRSVSIALIGRCLFRPSHSSSASAKSC